MTATKAGGPREHPPNLTLELEHGLVCLYRAEARRRDMSVKMLISDLLDKIARQITSLVQPVPYTVRDKIPSRLTSRAGRRWCARAPAP